MPRKRLPPTDQEQAQAVEQVKTYYSPTGKRSGRRPRLAHGICQALALEYSERSIAKRYSVSRQTIRAIQHVMEQAGQLVPLKAKLSGQLTSIVDLASRRSIERLERDEVPSQTLPIMMGVAFDKWAHLEGQPTQIIEHRHVLAGSDQFLAALNKLRGEPSPAPAQIVDVSSEVVPDDKPQEPQPQ